MARSDRLNGLMTAAAIIAAGLLPAGSPSNARQLIMDNGGALMSPAPATVCVVSSLSPRLKAVLANYAGGALAPHPDALASVVSQAAQGSFVRDGIALYDSRGASVVRQLYNTPGGRDFCRPRDSTLIVNVDADLDAAGKPYTISISAEIGSIRLQNSVRRDALADYDEFAKSRSGSGGPTVLVTGSGWSVELDARGLAQNFFRMIKWERPAGIDAPS